MLSRLELFVEAEASVIPVREDLRR